MNPRERLEEIEEKSLAPYATKSSQSIGRTLHGDEPDDYRVCFQRDRDRILYSKAFKDLQYKTQVFLISEGDFYRTRLTHTLEVAQHARTLARALGLNEDLCEAISYAHDLGHAPFGHAGEETLNEIMKNDGGFEHNLQSLRVVDILEKRYQNYDGLNLCYETREGIARHESVYDNPQILGEFKQFPMPSLEAQVVNIADPLAYCAHDIEDALNAGYLSMQEIKDLGNPLVYRVLTTCRGRYRGFEDLDTTKQARLLVRTLIEETNIAAIEKTVENLKNYKIESVHDARKMDAAIVAVPIKDLEDFRKLQQFLMENVYKKPQVCIMNEKGRLIIERLFEHLEKRPEMLPKSFKVSHEKAQNRKDKHRVIADYISGMTDRYAMDLYQMMFEPYEKVMFEFRE
ncbi:MAG: deoxyguanosinetriphosphate triphosphohydrolase [Proteobacteria bacterium]|nr:deoxyguanosinetriphosphate triphosphohydrolase [Pseudomonadota bacterium]